MISLKGLFKRNTLNDQGTHLSKIVIKNLVSSDKQCCVDFDGISTISSVFFQDFIFPLVLEFGSETIANRLRLINLNDEHLDTYREACAKSSDYMERIAARQSSPFGDISDLTFELLIKARELSRLDPSAAQVIFGINCGMIEFFANMDIDQIRQVASSGIVCFEPRFTPEFSEKLAAMEASEIDVFLNAVGDMDIGNIYEPEYS